MKRPDFIRAGHWLFERLPDISAFVAFMVGAITLWAAVTPELPHVRGLGVVERFADELPEFTASVLGVVLMGLATGLRRRLDAAWAATAGLLAAAALYAFYRHDHYIMATFSGLAALGLLLGRRVFFRRSRLVDLFPDGPAALGIAAVMGAACIAGVLWAGSRPGFAQAPWWGLITDPHLGRPGRTLAGAALACLAFAAWRYLLSRRKKTPPPAGAGDYAQIETILAETPDAPPAAELAFTGDKSFIFVPGAFVMTARSRDSLIAMSGAIGRQDAWREALAAFRTEAERLSLRPVVYAATLPMLPALLDLKFQVEKIGENAVIELKDFTLKGSARQNLRTARNRLVEREGAVFEMRMPASDTHFLESLRPVSDAWLATHGAEKSFSLGKFDPDYLARHHLAVVSQNGVPIAFASLWFSPDRKRAAIDLMRHDPDKAPNGTMEFLFAETILWAQASGADTLNLGMAPLTGLASDQYASLFARLGRMVAHVGSRFYGFEGLRAFKEKFRPDWQPVYIAAPGTWQLPVVLAEVALLTSTNPTASR